MTTEEIEKAAGEYSGEELTSGYPYVHPAHRQFIEARHEAFKAGAEFADKHWQEKTRWIPIEERLPDIKTQTYPIYAKNEKEKTDYAILIVSDIESINYLRDSFTHWRDIYKEIEL